MDALLRRRMMMAGGSTPPVPLPDYVSQEDLVFWFDGFLSVDGQGNAKELIQNEVLSKINAANISFANGGMVLSGGALYRTDNVLESNPDYTVEVCFIPVSFPSNMILFCSNDTSSANATPLVCFLGSGGRITHRSSRYSNSPAYVVDLAVDEKYTISMNATGGMKNGATPLSTGSGDYYANFGSTTCIGCRRQTANAYSAFFYGTVYSVRVYSRQLTEAEMLHNQAVDNERFNLGLTINQQNG